jgi:hypothetical protein
VVAHTYNPSYLGGGDWEDQVVRPTKAKKLMRPSNLNQQLGMVSCACNSSCAGSKNRRIVV